MAVWRPPRVVGQREVVGRRLLNDVGELRPENDNGEPKLTFKDFHETRPDEDLSVDRLGDPNPSRGTLTAITTVADEEVAETKRPQSFLGWATIRVKDFSFPGWIAEIEARPTFRSDGSQKNRWHAEVNRDGYRDRGQSYALAITLQHTFERKGSYVSPRR